MADQLLQPFKAYFEYSFNDSLDKLYDDKDTLQLYLNRKATDSKAVNVADFLKSYLTTLCRPLFITSSKIPFNSTLYHSVKPEQIGKDDIKANVSFKVKSDEVEVIQILKDDITFTKLDGTVLTAQTNEQTRLVRL